MIGTHFLVVLGMDDQNGHIQIGTVTSYIEIPRPAARHAPHFPLQIGPGDVGEAKLLRTIPQNPAQFGRSADQRHASGHKSRELGQHLARGDHQARPAEGMPDGTGKGAEMLVGGSDRLNGKPHVERAPG